MKILIDRSKPTRVVGCSLIAAVGLTLQACAIRHSVIATTGTIIGVEIGQNPTNQMPQAKLGYNRAEIAIVPTNRSIREEAGIQGGGAKDVADVLMELRYSGIFSTGAGSGIYQRLAVGSTAVQQPGASLMFAKDPSGQIPDKALDVLKSLKTIPAPTEKISAAKLPLANVFRNLDKPEDKKKFDEVVKAFDFCDFNGFLINRPREPTLDEIKSIRKALEAQGFKFTP